MSTSSPINVNVGTQGDIFRQLFEFAPDAMLIVSQDGRVRLNNAQADKLLEARPGQLQGLRVEDLVPSAARANHIKLRQKFNADPHTRPMGMGLALRALKLSGAEFPVEISLAPVESSFGREVIVVMRDVSERLRARRTEYELVRANAIAKVSQLALSERSFDNVATRASALIRPALNATTVALFLRAPNHADMICKAFDSVLNCQLVDLTLDHSSPLLSTTAQALAPVLIGDSVSSSLRNASLTTEDGFRSLIAAPLSGGDEILGLLVTGSAQAHHFATEDVAFVEAMANIISNALQRSRAEDRLLLSQRLESLGQLTGGVAHDFNNLLTVVSGNLQLLEDPKLPPAISERAIAAARRAAKRGADLTGKLLAFARRQTLHPSAIELPSLLDNFQDLLTRTLGPNIKIVLELGPDLPPVLADSGQLETALLNLAVNSRDAMETGGTLTIATEIAYLHQDALSDEAKPGEYVCIQVSDSGCGMNEETLVHAFEPFFTTKAIGKGSGLGLSMVYGFIKQSAGHITAQSTPGVGTTFKLYLPTTTRSDEARVSAPLHSSLTGTETLLVVEDDQEVQRVAAAFLEALGYQVLLARNLRTARTRLREHPEIKLLFTDVVLQNGETGPKVAAALQKIQPSLRVLYASGYAKSALPLQINVHDDIIFLHKPYTKEELGNAVRTALQTT